MSENSFVDSSSNLSAYGSNLLYMYSFCGLNPNLWNLSLKSSSSILMISSSFWRVSSLLRITRGNLGLKSRGFSNEIIKTEPLSPPDFLLQNLKNCRNTNQVFDLIRQHSRIMNKNHLIQALRTIFSLHKQGLSTTSTQQILQHPDFEKLCASLRRHAGLIELNETIDALKVVSYVGVSSNSTIVQVLLQLLKHNINELSLQKIIFVDFLLGQMRHTPLVEALQIALPIVFEITLPLKMDRQDITHLAEYLQYASKRNVSEKCVDLIVNAIMSYRGEIDVKSAISIIWSICDMKKDVFFEPLLNKAIQVVNFNIDSVRYDTLDTTMSKLVAKYSPETPFYYNEAFFDLCAGYIVERDLGFESGIYLLKKFCKLYHMSVPLLDYLTKKVLENKNLISNGSASHVCNFIIGLSMTDYRPDTWNELRELIEKTDIFSTYENKVHYLKLASALCVLEIYKEDVLQICFQPDFIHAVLSKRHRSDIENILCVYQALSTFRPDLLKYLPEQEINDIIIKSRPPTIYPLKADLVIALGGENYVKTGLKTRIGHYIDHALLYRPNGIPVAFSNEQLETSYLENLDHGNNQLILVRALDQSCYSLNGARMKGTTLLELKTLEATGNAVVAINLRRWEQSPDFERIPYLMQEIKNKVSTKGCDLGVA